MNDTEVLQTIKKHGIVAIVRGTHPDQIKRTVQALYDGGVRIIEVAYNTENVQQILLELTKEFGGQMVIGAGTVLDPESARSAILCGAQFILSPSLDPDVIRMCQRYSVLAVPGVMTPTEAVQAWETGARIIKVFPAVSLGPSYIRQLLGPLNQLDIMVVGGISLDNLDDFLSHGAVSAGIGSDLVSQKDIDAGQYDVLKEKAKKYVGMFHAHKQNGGSK